MQTITPGGGNTGAPLNLQKRLALMAACASLEGMRILDGGCGSGQYVLGLLAAGADAWGIDYEADKVAQFRAENPAHAERVSQGNVERLPFGDAEFDAALLNEVLEHVPNDRMGLRETLRVLKPGGWLFVFSPNRAYPFEAHGVYLGQSERRVPHYAPFIPYIPVPLGSKVFRYWARNYWPGELRRLIGDAGFEIVGNAYVWQTFENISGKQPRLLGRLKPGLRQVAAVGERVPGLQMIGAVSQFVAAIRPPATFSAAKKPSDSG
jgi:ubiquinone/menaquinone biosynthesis C-methylase UbiE